MNMDLILWVTDTIVWWKEWENADLCGGIFFVYSRVHHVWGEYGSVDVLQIEIRRRRIQIAGHYR